MSGQKWISGSINVSRKDDYIGLLKKKKKGANVKVESITAYLVELYSLFKVVLNATGSHLSYVSNMHLFSQNVDLTTIKGMMHISGVSYFLSSFIGSSSTLHALYIT